MTCFTFFAVLFLTLGQVLPAINHYVSPDGTASWSESTDMNFPCSLASANRYAEAGDIVTLREGKYTTYIAPINNGRDDDKRLIFRSHDGERAVINGTRYAIHLDGNSYVTVRDIDFENCHQFLIIQHGHHNNILNCSFERNKYETTWMGSWVHDSSTYNRIIDCTFSRFGWVQDGDDKGAVLDIGYDTSTTDATNFNVIENNIFFYGGHHILHICSSNNVIRGNYLHNEPWMECEVEGGCGNRNTMTVGPMAERNLFEYNRFAFAGKPPDDNGANGLVIRCPNNIVRRNMSYANGAGGIALASMTVSIPTDNCIYFNTIYHNGYDDRIDHFWHAGITFGNWGNGIMPGNIIINNIMHDNRNGTSIGGYGDSGPQVIENNWMDEGDPGFLDDTIPVDTSDGALPDFHLKEMSLCIDKGIFLTSITSETGSGTHFTVENSGFFYDGWDIPGETGDMVQLEKQKVSAIILKVDYESNIITIDRPLSWTKGQGISLSYSGIAPDLGAFEYNPDNPIMGDQTKPSP